MKSLLEAFEEVIDSGTRKMDDDQTSQIREKINEIVDRAVAARKRPRETV